MKQHLLYILCTMASIVFINSCGDNATNNSSTQSNGTGEIYGYVQLYDCYGNKETNQSRVTAQLLVENNIKQTVATDATGLFTFKNVGAGVYGIRFYKKGSISEIMLADTLTTTNIQFVGSGRYEIENYRIGNSSGYRYIVFRSTQTPDSLHWAIKPLVRYALIKNVDTIRVWIKDSIEVIDSLHHLTMTHQIFGKGTKETSVVSYTVDFEKDLPSKYNQRQITLHANFDDNNDVWKTTFVDGDVKEVQYEINTYNTIIRDSLGNIMTKQNNPITYSVVGRHYVKLWATSEIPNGILDNNKPKRIASTNVVTLDVDK